MRGGRRRRPMSGFADASRHQPLPAITTPNGKPAGRHKRLTQPQRNPGTGRFWGSAGVSPHTAARLEPPWHDSDREHTTAWAVGRRRSHVRDGDWHNPRRSGACAYDTAQSLRRRHDGNEHRTAWAIGHRRSRRRDGSTQSPLRSGACAHNMAQSLRRRHDGDPCARRHGPSVIAARAHETAVGTARSTAVLVHPRWAWAVGMTVTYEYTTAWAVGHRHSYTREGSWHGPHHNGARAC